MTTAPVTKKSIFNRPEKAYVHPYLGGMILGIVLFLAFFLTGNGLGSSGATSRIDALIVDSISPSHVDNNPYLLKMAGGDKNPLDDWIVPVFFGALLALVMGTAAAALTYSESTTSRTIAFVSIAVAILAIAGVLISQAIYGSLLS